MLKLVINPERSLTATQLRDVYQHPVTLSLSKQAYKKIHASQKLLKTWIAEDKTIYGVNTGFGKLAHIKIPEHKLEQLQYNLLTSHATGVGDLLTDEIVRLILVIKIFSLAQGYSGIRANILEMLIVFNNTEFYPCIPAKGSVGASGDLAPLAHLALPLIGEGFFRHHGKIISAKTGLKKMGLEPLTLEPKEGLALINGTQVSTGIALASLFQIENIFSAAVVSGCLSLIAAGGNFTSFDAHIQRIRRQVGQIDVAKKYLNLLGNSSSNNPIQRTQDPYSLRCQPQVMGACLDQIRHASHILSLEANSVTDNPLIFTEDRLIISGGNFHAEPVAFASDNLALAIAEIGSIAERRIALLIDGNMSGLPSFLSNDPGVESGFMVAHVTAAALVSENKTLAHPASVDNIPTSANQEDHVSMATFAARRLLEMNANTAAVIAIEMLAASQGIFYSHTTKISSKLSMALTLIHDIAIPAPQDVMLAGSISALQNVILEGRFNSFYN